MNRKLSRYLILMVTLSTAFAIVLPASAQFEIKRVENTQGIALVNAVPKSPNGIYIVQMKGDPVVAYDGSVKGLKATKPAKGKKIDPNSKEVTSYVRHLNGKHSAAMRKVKGSKKVYNYHYSFNGFAAKMTQAQAKKMLSVDGVVNIFADELQSLDTASTPDFLGITAPGGLWDMGVKGEDVIIGIVDGGIWPESLSFSDRTGSNGNGKKDGKLDYQQIPGWHGKCVPGEAFNASHCNQKLIGARYYNRGFGGNAGIDAAFPWEFNSPRDFGGHGTHTSSTSGGNADVPMTGAEAFFGSANGIAPRARIASYKVCWQTPDGGSCYNSDSIAAINQAVADGVDVINYSVGGSRDNLEAAVEIAFMFAADAGVFVAASAGNGGPGASTVAHPGPWLTTVAASTHDRNYDAMLTLGNDADYTGASSNNTGAGPADLVYSADVLLDGADLDEGRLCYPGTLDPALVAGKIVLCDRGEIARVDKSLAVFTAGGVGSILANVAHAGPGSTLNSDPHSVPTVHVDNVAGDAIRAYTTGGGTPTAEIFPSYFSPVPAPAIAGFSSRGPIIAGGGDLLKPDVSAPGVDILAAVAPPGNDGQDFASYQGTSMSSPHVAGLGALLTEMHPDWSPMMIKSALMTTGYDLISGADPFAQGAGHVDPTKAGDPGLVFDHGIDDWRDVLFYGGAVTDLNTASIASGALLGSQATTRTLTSVGDASETYDFSVSVPGIDVTASPSSFTISPGASQQVELTLTVAGAAVNTYTSGFAYWTGDNGHVVRIPVVVKPAQIKTEDEVDGFADGAGDGSVDVSVEFGYTGTYSPSVSGIFPGFSTGVVNLTGPQGNAHTYCVDLPANTHVRVATFDDDTSDPGNDDIDLDVLLLNADCETSDAAVERLGSSGGETSEEIVDIPNGPAGAYYVVVVFYGASNGTDTDYNLWLQPVFGDDGNTSVTAPAAVLGESGTVTVDYTGIAPTRNLGVLHHADDVGEIGRTILDIDGR
jgi:subtilisin family serine protease